MKQEHSTYLGPQNISSNKSLCQKQPEQLLKYFLFCNIVHSTSLKQFMLELEYILQYEIIEVLI